MLDLPQKTLVEFTLTTKKLDYSVKSSLDQRSGDIFLFSYFLTLSIFSFSFSSHFPSAVVHYQEYSLALINLTRHLFGASSLCFTPTEFLNLSRASPTAWGWLRIPGNNNLLTLHQKRFCKGHKYNEDEIG